MSVLIGNMYCRITVIYETLYIQNFIYNIRYDLPLNALSVSRVMELFFKPLQDAVDYLLVHYINLTLELK